jgi:hypothetical protein
MAETAPDQTLDGATVRAIADDGSARDATVTSRLHQLEAMDRCALASEWRRLYRVEPPKRVSRDLLRLGVAWKIQEQAYGGLSPTTRRRLTELAAASTRDGGVPRYRIARLRPGAKLVRSWRGKSHTVTVLEDGFEWQGRRWRSLSAIARAITGAHWSGPRFFGLTGKTSSTSDRRDEELSDA